MASLPTRTTASFDAIKPVSSLVPLDNEFNQLVGATGIFNGGTTGTKLLTKTSDAADPVYEFDQVGAGPIVEFKQNGALKAWVNNSGQIVSEVTTGTAPFDVDSTTKVTNLNADLLDGLSSADFAQVATNKTAFSVNWFYSTLPGAVESTESVGRWIVPAGNTLQIIDIIVSWVVGPFSGASNIFTIKRRNAAGTLQSDVGTIDLNGVAQNAIGTTTLGSPLTLTTGDQLYPLFTTRNSATETVVTIAIRGKQLFTT